MSTKTKPKIDMSHTLQGSYLPPRKPLTAKQVVAMSVNKSNAPKSKAKK